MYPWLLFEAEAVEKVERLRAEAMQQRLLASPGVPAWRSLLARVLVAVARRLDGELEVRHASPSLREG